MYFSNIRCSLGSYLGVFTAIQSQKTQGFCVADFATLSDETRSRSKIFPLFIWIKEPCVRKYERLERSKLLGISQTILTNNTATEAYREKHCLSIYASGLRPWRKSQNFLIRRLPKCCRHCNHILFTQFRKQFFVGESPNCVENCVPIYATCSKTQHCGIISRETPCNEKHFRPSSLRRIIHFLYGKAAK